MNWKKRQGKKEGVKGIAVNLIIPEQNNIADVFAKCGYEQRIFGNTIYLIQTKDLEGFPMLKKFERLRGRHIVKAFSDTPNAALYGLYSRFGKDIPMYLSPSEYGGVLQKDLSFATQHNGSIDSFIACSLFPEGELYLGGIYTERHDGTVVAALIDEFVDSLKDRNDIRTVVFSAATVEGSRIAESVLKEGEGQIWTEQVINYFKAIAFRN